MKTISKTNETMIYNTHMACPQMCKQTLINKPLFELFLNGATQAKDVAVILSIVWG